MFPFALATTRRVLQYPTVDNVRPRPHFRPVTPCHSPKKARIQTARQPVQYANSKKRKVVSAEPGIAPHDAGTSVHNLDMLFSHLLKSQDT
jgi:hypothetical protein